MNKLSVAAITSGICCLVSLFVLMAYEIIWDPYYPTVVTKVLAVVVSFFAFASIILGAILFMES